MEKQKKTKPEISQKEAIGMGFTGDECKTCHSYQLKNAGSCKLCMVCGETTGCS